ncbi:Hypothetical protein SCF082_LOCUS5940 [Durusdinium trenchii]|uniref:Uncharacterized protein n=1 Tax=Durusdinium trenchii TaxID=1381693 RepID=A0ABP0I9A9_9DINO
MASLPKLGEITSRTFKAALGALPAVQVRWASNKNNSVSLLQQFYNKLPIRKKFRVALRRGTMVMCPKTGQVRIPPLAISGYDDKKNPYRGRLEDLRAPRVWFKD